MKKIAITAGLTLATLLSLGVAPVPSNVVLTPAVSKPSTAVVVPVVDETIGGKPYCVSRLLVHATPEVCYQILSDYPNASRVFPMLKKCQLIEDRGSTKIVKHEVQPSGPLGTYEYTLEIKETPGKSLEWHRLAGDFKEVDGFWKLYPMDGGRNTLVTYSTHLSGGIFMPQMLIKRQFRMDMPVVMTSLKRQAEGTAKIAGRPGSARTE